MYTVLQKLLFVISLAIIISAGLNLLASNMGLIIPLRYTLVTTACWVSWGIIYHITFYDE
jgi:hypothetical protein